MWVILGRCALRALAFARARGGGGLGWGFVRDLMAGLFG